MKEIPTQLQSPKGLHQRYVIQKIVKKDLMEMNAILDDGNEFKLVEPDWGAEYFVLRLDKGGKDREHIKACRIGVHAYADAIEHHLPELAKDLKERYPLL